MKILCPKFPTFESWIKEFKCNYTVNVGEYYFKIAQTTWSMEVDGKGFFEAAVSTSPNPTNVYSKTVISISGRFRPSEKDKLEEWYTKTISELFVKWEDYMFKTYFF